MVSSCNIILNTYYIFSEKYIGILIRKTATKGTFLTIIVCSYKERYIMLDNPIVYLIISIYYNL